MDDSISTELAGARYFDARVPLEDITGSLPKGWRSLAHANGHPIDTCLGAGHNSKEWQSIVQPALSSSDNHRLPLGWDHRLDSMGQLFHIHHHTKIAQSAHPKDDGLTNITTGLPIGWRVYCSSRCRLLSRGEDSAEDLPRKRNEVERY